MTDTVIATLPLTRWQGDRGTYHLVVFKGDEAEAIAMHARLHRLEFGKQRGFGSVKVVASIGETEWKSSVFPQSKQTEWVLLINKTVMRKEDLAQGEDLTVTLKLL